MYSATSASRDISALTFCVGPEGLARVKQRIQEFRRELIELVESETDRNQVLQLNLQLFPLSRPLPRPKRAGAKAG